MGVYGEIAIVELGNPLMSVIDFMTLNFVVNGIYGKLFRYALTRKMYLIFIKLECNSFLHLSQFRHSSLLCVNYG